MLNYLSHSLSDEVLTFQCTADGICDRCFKLAGDPLMARQICIRHKLKDVYLGVKGELNY